MELIKTPLNGVHLIKNRPFSDHRGDFRKLLHVPTFKDMGLETKFKEAVYSTSTRNVVRGMHFQIPPADHVKLVWVSFGVILDVALCVDRKSEDFGRYCSQNLNHSDGISMYIGKGYAHGFRVISDVAVVNYMTTTVHAPKKDMAVRWNSFGMSWRVANPILSTKDQNAMTLEEWRDMK